MGELIFGLLLALAVISAPYVILLIIGLTLGATVLTVAVIVAIPLVLLRRCLAVGGPG